MENNSRIQLFCLPFAGGNAHSFQKFTESLEDYINPITIEYSGRGSRRNEPYIEGYDDFLNDVALQINCKRNHNLPFAILGYSLGSAVAYDLIRENRLDGTPQYLFLCAREFLANKNKSQTYAYLTQEEFISKIRELGGIDERLLNNTRVLNAFTQPLREDYIVWSQYKYFPLKSLFPFQIHVFYCEKDTPREKIVGWSSVTNNIIQFSEYGENHFFIKQYYKEMADEVNKDLLPYVTDSIKEER